MNKTLNYLKNIFGANLYTEYNKFYNAFPMYMTERYSFYFIKLPNDDQSYVLVKPLKKQEINIIRLKKQMKQIHDYSKSTPVFVLDSLRLSQRNILIQNNIPFIQTEHQIYIPSKMISLNEREVVKKEYSDDFSVATQVTYIFILLNNIKETNAPRLAAELPYSKITFNRALAELVSRGLLYTEGNNTRKIYKTIELKEFWKKGKQYLFNPVDKVFYADYGFNHSGMFISGETALSRLGTMLNESVVGYFAASADLIKEIDKSRFINKSDIVTDEYLTIEQFKYNPGLLSNNHYIDIISLYAQLKDSDDERIEMALDELLEEVLR